MQKEYCILTYGSLRLDLSIPYDFSKPLEVYETVIPNFAYRIGGSVYNTTMFLAELLISNHSLSTISMIVPEGGILYHNWALKNRIPSNLKLLMNNTTQMEFPLSIIGVDDSGDKRMLSFNPVRRTDSVTELHKMIMQAEIVYTSFYEIGEAECNALSIAKHSGNTSIVIDLCPLIGVIPLGIVRSVLSYTTVLCGNENEFRVLLERMCMKHPNELFTKYSNIKEAWMKQGENGSTAWVRNDDNAVIMLSQRPITQIVAKNTTGCGDVYNAVVLHGMMHQTDKEIILRNAIIEGSKIAEGGIPWIR